MADSIILGLDFLEHFGCNVDLSSSTVTIQGELVDATLKRNADGQRIQVSRVVLTKRTVVPPDSLAHAWVKFTGSVDSDVGFCVESSGRNKGLMLANAVVYDSKVPVRILNPTSRFVTLHTGHHIGNAVEVSELVVSDSGSAETDDLPTGVFTAEVSAMDTDSPQDCEAQLQQIDESMPEKLKDLFQWFEEGLQSDQAVQLGRHLLDLEFLQHEVLQDDNQPPGPEPDDEEEGMLGLFQDPEGGTAVEQDQAAGENTVNGRNAGTPRAISGNMVNDHNTDAAPLADPNANLQHARTPDTDGTAPVDAPKLTRAGRASRHLLY